jgi:hypothetical protein
MDQQDDLFHCAAEKHAALLLRREQEGAQKQLSMPPSRALHQHSLDAHAATEETMTGRKRAIMEWLRAYGPATDRHVKEALFGGADMNTVRPRITELIAMGLCHEVGSIKDEVTGLHVRIVRARMEGETA